MSDRPTMKLSTRLRMLITATSAVALALASGAFLAYDYTSQRRSMERELGFLSRVVEHQAHAALASGNRRGVSEILGALSQAHPIVGAAVYDYDGSLFARYLRADMPDELPSLPGADGLFARGGELGVFRPVLHDGRRIGTVLIQSNFEEAGLRLRLDIAIVGAVLIAVLLASYVLSARVVRTITGPIGELAEVFKTVTSRRDFTVRARATGPRELAVLVEGMNDMLSQIQVRDGALQLARSELENRVAERTAQLTCVNRELSNEIAERRKAEDSLRESEERYRQLVELSPDGILIHRAGRFVFANTAAARMFGAPSPDRLVDQPLLERVDAEFREAARQRLQEADASSRGTPPLDLTLLRLDGTGVEAEAQAAPFTFREEPAVLVVFRDISKRKEIERLKDEFVSTVSHELRTPITSIQGSLGLIASGILGALPPRVKPLIDIGHKNCSRLVLLINDILDSEKIAAGKMKFAFKPQDLMPLVEQSIDAIRAFGAQFNVRFELASSVPGARVDADSDRLIQVLTNLLSNAAKFSPKDDVVRVAVMTRESGLLRIAVSDRGRGIPPEFRGRIFQKFSQADSSDTRTKGGTGLGLSISKAITEKHRGDLSFESEVGRGTTFYLDLPEWIEPSAQTSSAVRSAGAPVRQPSLAGAQP